MPKVGKAVGWFDSDNFLLNRRSGKHESKDFSLYRVNETHINHVSSKLQYISN